MSSSVLTRSPEDEPSRVRTWSLGRAPGEAVVFALALAARLFVTLTNGGPLGLYGYDSGVYYAAGDALTFGRLPYRDFVLLHPPGLMLVLTPFAALGRLTTDHAGFVTANFAFMLLGAVNAVLVVRVAKRMGLDRVAACCGGLFYALWFGSVGSEYLVRLEPLGNFFVLVGLLAYFAAQDSVRRYPAVVCGLAFGAAASVKIWWIVPLVVILAWQLVDRRPRRQVARSCAGAAASLLVINGPFFLAAPSLMWHMVVTQQLGRNRNLTSPITRLNELTSVGLYAFHLAHPVVVTVVGVLSLAFAAGCVLAWRRSSGRLIVVLAVVQIVLLLLAPSWFSYYTDFASPVLALTLAAAVGVARAGATGRSRAWRRRALIGAALPLAFVTAMTVAIGVVRPARLIRPFPGAELARAVASYRCVMSDAPTGLIELNVLSRNFADGCRDWVDVTGRTYGPDRAHNARGGPAPRRDDAKWQHDLLDYLRSGQAVVLVRVNDTGISRATMATIRTGGVIASAGHYRVYRTPH